MGKDFSIFVLQLHSTLTIKRDDNILSDAAGCRMHDVQCIRN